MSLTAAVSNPVQPIVAEHQKATRFPREWRCEPSEIVDVPSRDYHELWFELRSWGWRSLAIVPTTAGVSEFDLAEKLVTVGVLNTGHALTLINAEGVALAETDRTVALVRAAEGRGEQVVVVTNSVADAPAAGAVARAVNGALLVVRLGESERTLIERTMAAIGRERVLGAVTRPGS